MMSGHPGRLQAPHSARKGPFVRGTRRRRRTWRRRARRRERAAEALTHLPADLQGEPQEGRRHARRPGRRRRRRHQGRRRRPVRALFARVPGRARARLLGRAPGCEGEDDAAHPEADLHLLPARTAHHGRGRRGQRQVLAAVRAARRAARRGRCRRAGGGPAGDEGVPLRGRRGLLCADAVHPQRDAAREHPARRADGRGVVPARALRVRAAARPQGAPRRRHDADRREGHQPERRAEGTHRARACRLRARAHAHPRRPALRGRRARGPAHLPRGARAARAARGRDAHPRHAPDAVPAAGGQGGAARAGRRAGAGRLRRAAGLRGRPLSDRLPRRRHQVHGGRPRPPARHTR
mmetsp:Transcript_19797/g.50033  ORF Transcript_19797/g.50033 Transcript_19797/m.50033 type:complete len:352 (+) Transcript_19797:587-1642(+)